MLMLPPDARFSQEQLQRMIALSLASEVKVPTNRFATGVPEIAYTPSDREVVSRAKVYLEFLQGKEGGK